MKIEEAIEHCLLKAEQDCSSCGAEHKQLAEWLKELKDRRAADVAEVVRCGECIHRTDPRRFSCHGRRKDWFCADGERRSE